MTEKGQVFLWGKGIFGEFLKPVLYSSFDLRIIDFQIYDGFGLAMDCNNRIFSWGENFHGQLGLDDLENRKELCLVKKINRKNINKFSNGMVNFCVGIGDIVKLKGTNF